MRSSTGVGSVFGYTGEQFDGETGYTYLRARYLNPALGRFTSSDTVQPNAPGTQGYNVYAYVANNPTRWVDPSGHSAVDLGAQFSSWLIRPQVYAFATACALYVPGCAGALATAASLTRQQNRFGTIAWGTAAMLMIACALSTEVSYEGETITVHNPCLDYAMEVLDRVEKTGSPFPEDDPNPDKKLGKDPVPVHPPTCVPIVQDCEDGGFLYHYTNKVNARKIRACSCLMPGEDGNAYLTPRRYDDGWDAKNELSIPGKDVERRIVIDATGIPGAQGPYQPVPELDDRAWSGKVLKGEGLQLAIPVLGKLDIKIVSVDGLRSSRLHY